MFSQIDEITYDIVRHRRNGKQRIIRRGLTLEEAQAHCNDPRTSGEDWFDGYGSVIKKYEIVRYRYEGEDKVVRRGLTLEQAQAHCNDPKTQGDDWFDGYRAQHYRRR